MRFQIGQFDWKVCWGGGGERRRDSRDVKSHMQR